MAPGRIILLNGASSSATCSTSCRRTTSRWSRCGATPTSWTDANEPARTAPAGLATSQTVDAHGDCDIAVDTTRTGPEEAARVIAAALPGVPVPKAFERLRALRMPTSPA